MEGHHTIEYQKIKVTRHMWRPPGCGGPVLNLALCPDAQNWKEIIMTDILLLLKYILSILHQFDHSLKCVQMVGSECHY